jgi:hypothetical protein
MPTASELLPVILVAIVGLPQLAVAIFYIRAMDSKRGRGPRAQRGYLRRAERFYLALSLSLLGLSVVAIFAVPLIFNLS